MGMVPMLAGRAGATIDRQDQRRERTRRRTDAFRAFVESVDPATGMIEIRTTADGPAQAYDARLVGFELLAGDEVLVIPAGTEAYLVAGKIQRSLPAALVVPVPAVLPAGSRLAELSDLFHDQRAMHYLANAGAATISAVGLPAPTVDGTLSNDDDSGGAWVRCGTGGTLGTNAGPTSALNVVWRAWEPTLIARIRTGTVDLTNQRIWVALTSVTVDGSSSPAAAHLAGFRFDSSLDGTHWTVMTKDGSTATTVQGSTPEMAITTSEVYEFTIELTPTAAIFSINGVVVQTITTHLPGANTPLGVQVRIRNLAAENHFMRFGRASLVHR